MPKFGNGDVYWSNIKDSLEFIFNFWNFDNLFTLNIVYIDSTIIFGKKFRISECETSPFITDFGPAKIP